MAWRLSASHVALAVALVVSFSSQAAAAIGPFCGRCPAGDFLELECDRARGVDRRCRSCSEFCGEGVTDCIPNGDGGALCSHCNFNTQFPLFADDRDGDGYGRCTKCTPCNPDEYVFRPCAGTRNNICRKCSVCGKGETMLKQCTPWEDTQCIAGDKSVNCRIDCPRGEALLKNCDLEAKEDRVCLPCSDFCGEGNDVCRATGNGDAHCKSCTFDTKVPVFVQDADGDGWGICSFCTQCGENEYLTSECSGTLDSNCKECTECSEVEDEIQPCSETQDRTCQFSQEKARAVEKAEAKAKAKAKAEKKAAAEAKTKAEKKAKEKAEREAAEAARLEQCKRKAAAREKRHNTGNFRVMFFKTPDFAVEDDGC